jgi:hypothetical protein
MPYKRKRTGTGSTSKWSNGELSTLIYGITRLGEKEFTDLMSQTIFMKREHDMKIITAKNEADLKIITQLPDKNKHSVLEIAQKWSSIKLLRDLDCDRLRATEGAKILTEQDWMLAALLALNAEPNTKVQIPAREVTTTTVLQSTKSVDDKEKEEESKAELALPTTSDSTNIVSSSLLTTAMPKQEEAEPAVPE